MARARQHRSHRARFHCGRLSPREVPLAGRPTRKGCSTPIALGRSIFVTAPVEGNDAVLAFDANGKESWRAVFGKENQGKHRNGSGSNASPVSDGKGIFVYFKSGTFAALELDGKIRWKTDLVERFGKDTLFWDHGTSPVLTSKHVIMARMHQGESWLAAFDKLTGEIAWKVARNYSTPTECDHGYTTPYVLSFDGKEAVLVWGAEHVTVHDAAQGEVLWSCGNFNPEGNKLWPAIASPVVIGKQVVVAYGRNDRGIPRLHGIDLTGKGDVTATNHRWKRDDVGPLCPLHLCTAVSCFWSETVEKSSASTLSREKMTGAVAFPKGAPSFTLRHLSLETC